MKRFFIYLILAWSNLAALGQTQPTPYSIISRSGNSRLWERTTYELSPSGQVVPHLHHYMEVASGLCYQQNGQWADSQEQINIQPDGTASATAGQHQAYFPADIGNGVIKMVTPDGLTLQSQPMGLSLDDGTNTVLIAALTNSVGQLISPNQILYTNAFAGLDADLLYTYTKAGFEQDVILDEQPQSPEFYGLNSATARLELLTEFIDPPQPTVTTTSLPEQAGLALTDDTLDFGLMKMIPGRAFLLGPNAQAGQVMVGKQWLTLEGRQFLVEAVPVAAIEAQLSQLPMVQTSSINRTSPLNIVSAKRRLPGRRLAKNTNAHVIRVAQTGTRARVPARGMLLDYQTVNSSQTNTVFQGDTTYYISGTVNLFGTNTFEGGTVLKYATNGCIIQNSGSIKWLADAYRPVILTAVDDDTVGDTISSSTGNPTNYYAMPEALSISSMTSTSSISYFRISWASQGINILSSNLINLNNGQFVNCGSGIEAQYNDLNLGNLLFVNIPTDLVFFDGTINAQNVTFSESSLLAVGANGAFSFENCIFANIGFITNSAIFSSYGDTLSGTNNGFYNSPEFGTGTITNTFYPFQTVGAGSYYLTNGCDFRTNGTTGIDADLLAELAQKTTHPPFVFDATNFSSSVTLGPDVSRDTNSSPDLGYHYDPLDYVFGGCDLDTNLTFTPGTVVGWFEDNGSDGGPYGLSLDDGATLSLNGTATQPGYFVRFTMVQEAVNGNWTDRSYIGGVMLNGSGALPYPQFSGNFAKLTLDADAQFARDDWAYGVFAFQNCELYNGNLTAYAMQNAYFTNSLFFRVFAAFYDQDYAISFNIENCTFYDGFLGAGRWSGQSGDAASSWQIENTAFDGTDFSWTDNYNGSTHTLFNYNAYNTNNLGWTNYPFPYTPDCGTNEVTGPNDLMVTNYNWQTNWFGDFYLPTNSPLIKKGSTNANFLGLYHFTTQTNQVVEGTNMATIGYHYVATDTNGVPLDSNGDGIPDYLEDPLGNGLPYNGTNWALAINIQPTNQTVFLWTNVTLSVTAGGVPLLSYQWYFNSNLLANATNTTLQLDGVQGTNGGSYYVIVTNNFGAITSSVATLTVLLTTNLCVTNFGAVGDAGGFTVYSVSNSSEFQIVGTNWGGNYPITLGMVLQVFGAGPQLYLSNDPPYFTGTFYGTNPAFLGGPIVTQQDIICMITNVSNGTNIWGTIAAGYTGNFYAVMGTNNAAAFQAAVNDASNLVATAGYTNVNIVIPTNSFGQTVYLFANNEVLNLSYVPNYIYGRTYPAVTIQSGGIAFEGQSESKVIMMASGAGMNMPLENSIDAYFYAGAFLPIRTTIFFCSGAVQNNQYPLIFENFTFDGGVANGAQTYSYDPTDEGNGEGWDTTHHAVADYDPDVTSQMNMLKIFNNLIFQHWRGEQLICFTGPDTNCYNDIFNCTFSDCNATADNMYYGQTVSNCVFDNILKALEYYQGNADPGTPMVFEDNVITNDFGNYQVNFNGAITGAVYNAILITNNVFWCFNGINPIGIGNADNITIVNNQFYGTAYNSQNAVVCEGALSQPKPSTGVDNMTTNVSIFGNTVSNCGALLITDGAGYRFFNIISNYSLDSPAADAFCGSTIEPCNFGAGYIDNFTASYNSNFFNDSHAIASGHYTLDEYDLDPQILYCNQGDAYHGGNNTVSEMSYGYGQYHYIESWASEYSNWSAYLDTNYIPTGASLVISNELSTSFKVYADSSETAYTNVPSGMGLNLFWNPTNNSWFAP